MEDPDIQPAIEEQAANPAIDSADNSLVLWAESSQEARRFLNLVAVSGAELLINRIFVAKRSPNSRSNTYIRGEYYRTSDDGDVDVYDEVVLAPPKIIELVQWCTCDIMISRGRTPGVAVEDTTHIVRMNLYQRLPRLARAAVLGIPSLILQGTRGLNFTKRGDRWALHRYLQAFEAVARLYPESPSLPILYEPIEDDERRAQDFLMRHIATLLAEDQETVKKQRAEVISEIKAILERGVDGQVPPDLPSIDYQSDEEVIVRIGAKPGVKSWREKGSGQMDPYIGLIAAAKFIYCYDRIGKKTKKLVVEFTYLPKDFWFFSNPETTALYKRLPFELADEVRFVG